VIKMVFRAESNRAPDTRSVTYIVLRSEDDPVGSPEKEATGDVAQSDIVRLRRSTSRETIKTHAICPSEKYDAEVQRKVCSRI